MRGFLDKDPAVALPVFQRPGSNALETADQIIKEMEVLAQDFPPGLQYDIIYNPTEFIAQSIDAVILTIYEAIILVVIVIVLFLQTWRPAPSTEIFLLQFQCRSGTFLRSLWPIDWQAGTHWSGHADHLCRADGRGKIFL